MAIETWTLGVDLGGTKIKSALVDPSGKILESRRRATQADQGHDAVIQDIVSCVQECLGSDVAKVKALGIGVAGQVDDHDGSVKFAPNLGWRGVPLKSDLEEILQLPVYVTNDVRAITWGEWLHGSGVGVEDLVCVFVGTGIGGGIVAGGKLLKGATNAAGEVGHMTIVSGGRQCTCDNRGCLEAYAGGWGIAGRAREAIGESPEDGRRLLELAGNLEKIEASTVAKAYRGGDRLSNRLVAETTAYLAAGLVAIVNSLNPKMIILGGGVLEGLPELTGWVEPLVRRDALRAATSELVIVSSKLGAAAGVIGAAALARSSVLADPPAS